MFFSRPQDEQTVGILFCGQMDITSELFASKFLVHVWLVCQTGDLRGELLRDL